MTQSYVDLVEGRFAAMHVEWLALRRGASDQIDRWEQTREALAAEEERLRDEGKWIHGRADFLGVARRHRDELIHSRMIAWLLDPCGRHGLGTRALAGLVEEVFGAPVPEARLARARTRCEVPLADGRLDIVVEAPGLYLAIENKVDAEEGGQCHYYSRHLRAEARCILLSPDGRKPATPLKDDGGLEIANRFEPMRYTQLAAVLRAALAGADVSAPGRRVAEDYLTTLEREFE